MSVKLKDQPTSKYILTPEEGQAWFDKLIPEMLGISGEEFLRRYDAGEYANILDDSEHWSLIEAEMMIPLARPNSWGGC
jgi:hypothetical protein